MDIIKGSSTAPQRGKCECINLRQRRGNNGRIESLGKAYYWPSGPLVPAPGTPRNLKLISAVCGVYDGSIRCLPQPTIVDTLEDAETFRAMLENGERKQYVVAISDEEDSNTEDWHTVIQAYAKDAFALQHVVVITMQGLIFVREFLGQHGMPPGSMKVYSPGFSMLDVQSAHRLTGREAVLERGLSGMLDRWRKRLMVRDARNFQGANFD